MVSRIDFAALATSRIDSSHFTDERIQKIFDGRQEIEMVLLTEKIIRPRVITALASATVLEERSKMPSPLAKTPFITPGPRSESLTPELRNRKMEPNSWSLNPMNRVVSEARIALEAEIRKKLIETDCYYAVDLIARNKELFDELRVYSLASPSSGVKWIKEINGTLWILRYKTDEIFSEQDLVLTPSKLNRSFVIQQFNDWRCQSADSLGWMITVADEAIEFEGTLLELLEGKLQDPAFQNNELQALVALLADVQE